jgi:uncharacterized RDD family membrane protein YckC
MQNPPPPPPPGSFPPPPPPGGFVPPPPQMPYGGGYPMAPAQAANFGGFWIRVVAYIIDAIILGVVNGIVAVIVRANPTDPSSPGYGIASLLQLIISAAYFAGFWTYWGSTLGQRVLKLRVVDATTMQPIGFGKALVRWVGLLISFLVCFIGVIWVAFDARKQGWMDKIAGTVVLQS